ncbi:PBSX family phage terminase large subunit [uncultured Thomasclavelia sp.]|uniref:PBSX family phage terminase large subunit n=1 Tax=uncultured Thomasclavelia sp. TaxID=3025759 RepID=UPI0025975212|nr:PBSX family phage terminase large subunit [uncultured Thomasclavelia sp.]
MNKEIDIKISKKVFNTFFLNYLECTSRYLILYGGAGSGKSYFIVERYIYRILKSRMLNLLVVRKTGKSNRDSTFALFKQVINKWKLSKYFKINESDLRIKCLLNGNEIVFAGLDDVEKLKSITFSKGELTDVWIEEASEVLESDFNQLDVRLRGKGTKKQITISFNPIDVNHWLKKRFFDKKDDNITICHSTYKDNDFLDDDYKKLLESYKDTDPYYYDVYCLGKWGVLGKTVFDARAIQTRIDKLKKPLKIGFFTYNYDDTKPAGKKISNIKWINDKNGYIKIYQLPHVPKMTKYCIGGDTAGEGSDYFTGHVLDAKTGNQVAVFKNQMDADLYTKQMYCLGKYYASKDRYGNLNEALIAIEANFDSFPIRELQRLGYNNQYVRTRIDDNTGQPQKSFGFKTTSLTRPTILSNLIQIVREHVDTINDEDTLLELLTIVRNDKGRIEAPEGGHDDQMMGLAIAHESRSQVTFNANDIIEIEQHYNFNIEKPRIVDYGEKIEVI